MAARYQKHPPKVYTQIGTTIHTRNLKRRELKRRFNELRESQRVSEWNRLTNEAERLLRAFKQKFPVPSERTLLNRQKDEKQQRLRFLSQIGEITIQKELLFELLPGRTSS
ncbi:hypothetical protein KKE06_02285 [Candidatus Micrarchaeota archaeon]|nr:hypothetical protein [Candidatus Micrarchaeota archaeon]MBU1930676.1 hypothetical protein [Candidatus Micrarchaeota archaeon]